MFNRQSSHFYHVFHETEAKFHTSSTISARLANMSRINEENFRKERKVDLIVIHDVYMSKMKRVSAE